MLIMIIVFYPFMPKILLSLTSSMIMFVLNFRKIIHLSQMQNDALMHREGLTPTARGSTLVVRI